MNALYQSLNGTADILAEPQLSHKPEEGQVLSRTIPFVASPIQDNLRKSVIFAHGPVKGQLGHPSKYLYPVDHHVSIHCALQEAALDRARVGSSTLIFAPKGAEVESQPPVGPPFSTQQLPELYRGLSLGNEPQGVKISVYRHMRFCQILLQHLGKPHCVIWLRAMRQPSCSQLRGEAAVDPR